MVSARHFARNIVFFVVGSATLAVAGTSASAPPLDAADDAIASVYQGYTGVLGQPKGGVVKNWFGAGAYQLYEKGAIYWSAVDGARVVAGHFYTQYLKSGGPSGIFGRPITDMISLYDGVGQVQKYRRGTLIRRSTASTYMTQLLAVDTLVDLPIPVNQSWKVIQANGLAKDDSHNGGFAYCYDLVPADGTKEKVAIHAAATARVVLAQDSLPSGKTNQGNVVVQALGPGRYASYLHLAPGSWMANFGKNKVTLPGNPWPNRPTAPAGSVIGWMGDTGTDVNNHHLHFCVTTAPDRGGFAPFESVPVAFRNIEVSNDGKVWNAVAAATPVAGQFVRHAGFAGAAKIGLNDPLAKGRVNGSITLAGAPTLPIGGKIVIDLVAAWDEPVASVDVPITAANPAGPWTYDILAVPAARYLSVAARYSGPVTPALGGAHGSTGRAIVPSNGTKSGWNVTITAEKPNSPYIG